MQAQRGFSLIELVVVLAIMATLLALASLNWDRMNVKTGVETEIKKIQSDLMEVRLQALYSKSPRAIILTGTDFKIYASDVTTVDPITTKKLSYGIVWSGGDSSPLIFDAQGMVRGLTPDTQRCLCVLPTGDATVINEANVDSIVISQVKVNLGRRTGGDCASGNIKQQ